MADVTINNLSPITPSTGLVLPVSNGTNTGKVTLSQVCGVISSSQITNSLGYTPYNNTNPNGYISRAVDTITSGNFPVAASAQSILSVGTGSLANYKVLNIILRNVGFTAANTRIAVQGYNVSLLSHNNTSASVGIWVNCMMDLIGGTFTSVSENNSTMTDTGTSYVYLKSHPYSQSSTGINFYTSGSTNYFDGGQYIILGFRG